MENKKTTPAPTPGPWVWQENGVIKAERDVGKWDDYICRMPFSSLEEAKEIGAQQIPNARLIAAAPELLEACEMSLQDAKDALSGDWQPTKEGWGSIIEHLNRVIAKAYGKAP
jgi:hypothetical protein